MKNLDKKDAVSPSTATICSADAPDKDAERKTPSDRLSRHLQNCWVCATHQELCVKGKKLQKPSFQIKQSAERWR